MMYVMYLGCIPFPCVVLTETKRKEIGQIEQPFIQRCFLCLTLLPRPGAAVYTPIAF